MSLINFGVPVAIVRNAVGNMSIAVRIRLRGFVRVPVMSRMSSAMELQTCLWVSLLKTSLQVRGCDRWSIGTIGVALLRSMIVAIRMFVGSITDSTSSMLSLWKLVSSGLSCLMVDSMSAL